MSVPIIAGDSEENPEFGDIPADFPRGNDFSSLAGAQAKIAVTIYNGRYYSSGNTPPEILKRWEKCEGLAIQLAKKSQESQAGKRAHMSKDEILAQYLDRLIKTEWTSIDDAHWVLKRVAEILEWQPLRVEIESKP